MAKTKQALHKLNLSLQLMFIILLYVLMTVTFWVTGYNILLLIASFNFDYALMSLKSGGITLVLFFCFMGCLFTTALFNDNL